jgi:hypothetical protein
MEGSFSVPNLRFYLHLFLDEVRIVTKKFICNSQSLALGLNTRTPNMAIQSTVTFASDA